MEGSVPSRNNRVHVETASISLRLVALLSLRRGNILGDIMLEENRCCENCAYHDDWTWVCLIRRQMIEQTLQMKIMCVANGRKNQMTNRDIEDMKNRIDELAKIAKDKENENAVLKQQVKTQREKIDSLLKELEEEKGKKIIIGDGTISMRADMWETVNENRKLKSENDELRKRIEKLESDICGGSPCIVSEFHSFEGESWIGATTYDDVLLRLKKANERISDLEQKRLNQGLDSFNGIEAMQKLNDELKAENKALKQHIKDMEGVCDGSCFSDYEDLPYGDESEEKDALIAELQDQHQQDCIRINDLTTTVHVLAGLYSMLRKNVGMD